MTKRKKRLIYRLHFPNIGLFLARLLCRTYRMVIVDPENRLTDLYEKTDRIWRDPGKVQEIFAQKRR